MGTRSVTRVHDGDKKSPVLVAIYQQYDGYFEGVGENIQSFLKGMVVVNGISNDTPEKAANGMGCLAAQLVKFLKAGIGGTYIVPIDQTEEFNYDIYLLKNGKLALEGECEYDKSKKKKFNLNGKPNQKSKDV
jgi:hypothetical protein